MSSQTIESDSDDTADSVSSDNDIMKKRKKGSDLLHDRNSKIRKTLKHSSKNEGSEDNDFIDLVDNSFSSLSPKKESPGSKKVLQHSHKIEANDKENIQDIDWSESFGELDDFFEDDWKDEKLSVGEMDLDSAKRCTILDILWERHDMILTLKAETTEDTAVVKCSDFWYVDDTCILLCL